MARVKTGVLISGRGSNLQALIDATRATDHPAEIVLVISNVPGAAGLTRASEAGIPTTIVDHRDYGSPGAREAFEAVLTAAFEEAAVELVCLAGFMRVLTGAFVARWRDRLINIHPSLLPSFPGLDTHERALAEGVKLHGCTVHFVREAVD
ncbi:MAG: phosphoribosylglycinamide formyltransferase, partial [Kiloniellales bacterium]